MRTYKPAAKIKCFVACLFTSLLPSLIYAQKASDILSSIINEQQRIKTVSYTVQRIDTFRSGEVWDRTGVGHLRIDKQDTLFGYAFKAKRNDIPAEIIYEKYKTINIDHNNKTYNHFTSPGKGILGFPGGQMVFEDIVHLDTLHLIKIDLWQDEKYYVLKFYYRYPLDNEYDIKDRYKIYYVDKKLLLPLKMYAHMISLGQKESREVIIKDLEINQGDRESFNFNVSADYHPEIPRKLKDELNGLIGQKMPHFELTSFEGNKISSAGLEGKVILLDFWEVWCGPCVFSMPKLQGLYDVYKNQGLEVIGIMSERSNNSIAAAKQLLQQKDVSFTMVLGNEQLKKDYKVGAIPLYVLIDKKGKIIYAKEGYSDEILPFIEKALKE